MAKPRPTARTQRSVVAPPKQARGRATQQALISAFRRLLSQRSFGELSVNDIVTEAKSSVGSFYARFASKEALLVPVVEQLTSDASTLLDRATAGNSLEEVLFSYASTFTQWFSRNRRALQEAARSAEGDAASQINALFDRFNQEAHQRLRAAIAPFSREIQAPQATAAVEFGLFFASAAAREGVLPGIWRSYTIEPDEDQLARAIAQAWYAYLTTAAKHSERSTSTKRR